MSDADDKLEQVKGHAKEAAGEVTDNDKMKREGRRDRASGKAKEKIDRASDKLEEGVDKVKDKLTSRDRG
jgi:uncharacterized protein YjbJ (UPF0337 family)